MANLSENGKPNDQEYMKHAILEAQKAADVGEVPIGAVAVVEAQVVARAHNVKEATGNPLGHAEVLLIQQLSKDEGRGTKDEGRGTKDEKTVVRRPSERSERSSFVLRNWRLADVTIYVTCEPCLMCMGAMLQARIPRVVYGCKDPKAGACGSLYDVSNDARLNHRMEVTAGVLGEECGELLTDFFRAKRK